MNILLRYFVVTFMVLTNISSYAQATYDQDQDDESYYADEGRLVFKIRVSGIQSNAKQRGLPAAIVTPPMSTNPFVKNGYGGDTSTSIFFNDNIAAELSLGISVLNTKYTTLQNIAYNYSGTPTTSKKKKVYMIPLSMTGQYHIAPFGALRPYIGAGYHGAYLFSKAKEFKIKNGFGPVLQAGIDIVGNDDTFFNFDIKQYFLTAAIRYKGPLVSYATNVSSKVKINPLVVSAGVGFKL